MDARTMPRTERIMAKQFDKQITIKVTTTLWQEFLDVCHQRDHSAADRLRDFMDQYTKHFNQQDQTREAL